MNLKHTAVTSLPKPSSPNSNKDDSGNESGSVNERRLIAVDLVDRMFPVATAVAISVWVFLVIFVYALVPPEQYVYLDGAEREAAAAACYIFLVSTSLTVVPLMVRGSEKREVSGIVWAAVAVQTIAMFTNALLAWAPTVVVVDPVTHARVYLLRWCEWVPLSGLMTFFSEIVDCQEGLYGALIPVLLSLAQSLSCLCAVVLPFCPNVASWVVVMTLSCVLYLFMFPRLWQKYHFYKTTQQGLTLADMERSCRVTFGYQLLAACTTVWTVLVVLYFVNMVCFYYFPNSYHVKNQSLPMILDTLFDVLAKALYMKIIVNVHETVFDAEGRARRQLMELKRMITVLWESSSDVIVISVRSGPTFTTMISPTFPNMLGIQATQEFSKEGGNDVSVDNAALLIKSEELPVAPGQECQQSDDDSNDDQNQPLRRNDSTAARKQAIRLKSCAYFVDSPNIPYDTGGNTSGNQNVKLPNNGKMDDTLNVQCGKVVAAAWEKVLEEQKNKKKRKSGLFSRVDSDVSLASASTSGSRQESLVILDLPKRDGSIIKCEIKVSRHSDDAVIAIIRDVTERYLRFDAERRVHTEAIARQREAQAVNRFTRHEIKNGLLAGIELCQEVVKRVDVVKTNTIVPLEKLDEYDASKCLSDLDSCLHEVLDTVLAEAMAREVVHESYQPRLDRVDVYKTLAQNLGMHEDPSRRDRFPLFLCPTNMPCLSMDPQLLRYIHRNAVSNAVKYGRLNGKVTTEVHYFESGEFEMDIVNEPGPFNEKLVSMGKAASDEVFAQGTRLDVHARSADEAVNQMSTGDGAWIMRKCAKTMGGNCTIRFDSHQTIFSFRCKVDACLEPVKTGAEFQVPPGTYGVAFDDTAIQRKLMNRIMKYAGVEDARIVVKGQFINDIQDLDKLMLKLLSNDSTSKLLVLMDENLDYQENGVSQRLSGSKFSEQALAKLTPAQQARTIVLVRSANDSDEDIAIYNKRTHGFFPKASMQKEKVRELLAPKWLERFPEAAPVVGLPKTVTTSPSKAMSEYDEKSETPTEESGSCGDFSARRELMAAIGKVDEAVDKALDKDWITIWSTLHALKGDLIAVDHNKAVAECCDMLSEMRGMCQPKNFEQTWGQIRKKLIQEIE